MKLLSDCEGSVLRWRRAASRLHVAAGFIMQEQPGTGKVWLRSTTAEACAAETAGAAGAADLARRCQLQPKLERSKNVLPLAGETSGEGHAVGRQFTVRAAVHGG